MVRVLVEHGGKIESRHTLSTDCLRHSAADLVTSLKLDWPDFQIVHNGITLHHSGQSSLKDLGCDKFAVLYLSQCTDAPPQPDECSSEGMSPHVRSAEETKVLLKKIKSALRTQPVVDKFRRVCNDRATMIDFLSSHPDIELDLTSAKLVHHMETFVATLEEDSLQQLWTDHPGLVTCIRHIIDDPTDGVVMKNREAIANSTSLLDTCSDYLAESGDEDTDGANTSDMPPPSRDRNNIARAPPVVPQLSHFASQQLPSTSVQPPSGQSNASGRISAADLFSALNAAQSGVPSVQSQGAPVPSASEQMDANLARMREMGITDDSMSRHALDIMDGDLQAAVDLILSGWDGTSS